MILDITGVFNNNQSIQIFINGQEIYYQNLTMSECIEASFIMPVTKMISVSIVLEDAVSPFELGQSRDTRKLGIQIARMIIEQSSDD